MKRIEAGLTEAAAIFPQFTPEQILELRRQWPIALRSGTYAQATGTLKEFSKNKEEEGYRYCCLGVACDLAADRDSTKQLRWQDGEMAYVDGTWSADDDSDYDSPEHRFDGELDWNGRTLVGISSSFMGDLISLNDDNGQGFDVIANAIEEYYAEEFSG